MRRLSPHVWEAGVVRLYSEDFDAYPRVDGLEIVNPL
jgi:predicted nucleic acid-binding protein